MCDELNSELSTGVVKAKAMVIHLLAMGAGRCVIPVEADGRKYQVIVEEVPQVHDPKKAKHDS